MKKFLLLFLVGIFYLSGFTSLAQRLPHLNLNSANFKSKKRTIKVKYDRDDYFLDFKTYPEAARNLAPEPRMEHMQDIVRLPNSGGHEYYMGTWSQDCGKDEGGMIFVVKVSRGGSSGEIVWFLELDDSDEEGKGIYGINHPGDIRRWGDLVAIAGQNWDGGDGVLKEGNGGNAVLLFNVSNPASPRFLSKENHNDTRDRDIDALALTQFSDGKYRLWYNGNKTGSMTCESSDGKSWTCRSGSESFNRDPMLPVEYNGRKELAKVVEERNGTITFSTLQGKKLTSVPITKSSFVSSEGARIGSYIGKEDKLGVFYTFNITMNSDGIATITYANEHSGYEIDGSNRTLSFEVIELR